VLARAAVVHRLHVLDLTAMAAASPNSNGRLSKRLCDAGIARACIDRKPKHGAALKHREAGELQSLIAATSAVDQSTSGKQVIAMLLSRSSIYSRWLDHIAPRLTQAARSAALCNAAPSSLAAVRPQLPPRPRRQRPRRTRGVLRQTRPARADDAFNFSISRGYLSKLRYAVFARSGNDRGGPK
jgi:hypothetical protein